METREGLKSVSVPQVISGQPAHVTQVVGRGSEAEVQEQARERGNRSVIAWRHRAARARPGRGEAANAAMTATPAPSRIARSAMLNVAG